MSEARSKLDSLRKYVERSPIPDNLDELRIFDKQIKKAELLHNWLEHPVTKEIALEIVKAVEEVNQMLLAGLAGDKAESKLVARLRDEWKKMLQLFDPAKAKTQGIEKVIDAQLERFRDFYGEK